MVHQRLYINVDHIATVRQARRSSFPDPVEGALICKRAGADGIFIEAPRSVKELEIIGKAFDVPHICNPLMGGHTPILGMSELAALGFNCAVLGLDTLMHAAKAIEAVLIDMKTGKFAHRNDGMGFEEYKKLVGYDNWERIDERFAPRQ